jgi:hypothetical protein
MANKQPDADAVLADALGLVVAKLRRQWEKEMQLMASEAKSAVAEIKLAAMEILLEERASPEAVARLRAVGGRR